MASPASLLNRDSLQTELAQRSLSHFIRQSWPVLEPATDYLHNWHIDAMSEYLEAVTAGQITRLLINIPPRHGKSRVVTIAWPCWEWIRAPYLRYLFASYSSDLSVTHSVDRRTVLLSEWYRERWGHIVELTGDQNAKEEYRNTAQGIMVATSTRGTALGKGGNRVVGDDLHNVLQAESDLERQSTVRNFDRGLSTRLNDKKKDAIVVVMQRLHEEDVSARCIELGYVHLKLPAEAEERTTIVLPMSGRKVTREAGELLWPEREGPAEIAQAKRALGPYAYAGQYQQRPTPATGGIFKRAWFRFWRPKPWPGQEPLGPVRDDQGTEYVCVEMPEAFDEQIQSWDTSFKKYSEAIRKGKEPDPVSGGLWGRKGADSYLLDRVNERMDVIEAAQAIRDMTAKWPRAMRKLIEDKGNGPAIRAMLQRDIPGLIPVTPIGSKVQRVMSAATSEDDKDARAVAVTSMFESGNVYFPHPAIAPWAWDCIKQFTDFPMGANDDDVDMTSQALTDMQRRVWMQADSDESMARKYGPPLRTTHDILKHEVRQAVQRQRKPQSKVNPWLRRKR